MAEPPASERRPRSGKRTRQPAKTPPIPSAARTRRTKSRAQTQEVTAQDVSVHGTALCDHVIGLAAACAEHFAQTDASDGNLTDVAVDLNLRLALLCADRKAEAMRRHLDAAAAHPLAARLTLGYAAGDPETLEVAQTAIDTVVEDAAERTELLTAVAEAWLYRHGDPARAAKVARLALGGAAGSDAGEVVHILSLALAAAGEWQELGAVMRDQAMSAGTAPAFAEAAHIALDRLGDASGARDLLARAVAKMEAAADPVAAFHVLGLALDTIAIVGEQSEAKNLALGHGPCMDRRIEVAASDDRAIADTQALRYARAENLAHNGDAERAAEIMATLSSPSLDPEADAWGPRLAAHARYALARDARDWRTAAASARDLGARTGAGTLAASYKQRAAELLGAVADDAESARTLWREILDDRPGDARAAREIEAEILAGDAQEIITHLEIVARGASDRAPALLRRASAVAESRATDIEAAHRLRVTSMEGAEQLGAHLEIARLCRARDDIRGVADQYRALARVTSEQPRLRSLFLCALGAIELCCGRLDDAEAAFSESAQLATTDVIAPAALAAIRRTSERWSDLADSLTALADVSVRPETRIDTLRELGLVAMSHLGDKDRARTAFEGVLALEPDDSDSLRSLARLSDDAKDWAAAVSLRRRAVDAVVDPVEQVPLLLEIGDIEESRRGDESAALKAYEQAAEIDDEAVEPLRAAGRIYRRRKMGAELLRVLRAELRLVGEPTRLLAVHLEIAKLAEDAGEHPDSSLASYQDALAIDPGNDVGLAGIEALARREKRWDVLAEAFGAAPKTAANLAVLAEALAAEGRWAEHASALRAAIDETDTSAEQAQLARQLAEVCEHRLEDRTAAIGAYRRALTAEPGDAESQRELSRLLEETESWPDLCVALERELSHVPAADVERQVALLSRIGGLRRDRLDAPAEAATAFESVIELSLGHAPSLAALEALYVQLARPRDLARILDARAQATEDLRERATLCVRMAEAHLELGDSRNAVSAYQRAFAADPTSRETFTALEELCYRNELWQNVRELYRIAIEMVESGESRAFRLSDLYARLGQLQTRYLGHADEAALSYLRVVELDPDNDDAIERLESIYVDAGELAKLISAYEKRAELLTDEPRRIEMLRRAAAIAATRLNDEAEAARVYQKILDITNTDSESLDFLERYYERTERWDELVGVLTARLAVVEDGNQANRLLRRVARISEEHLRDESRAIEHYQRILEVSPNNVDALEALGRIYESTERWTDFVEVTRKQIRVTTDRNVKALLYFKCGSVMEAKFGKEDDAIRYYDAAIKTSPTCLPAVHGVRDLYRRREDWPRVIQTLELEVKLWQEDKERAGVFAQIGRIYADHLGEPERALHYFESALAVDPECLPANRALFEQFFEAADWQRAQPLAHALAQKAMREGDPHERSEFYRRYGIVARETGDLRAAAESLVIALEIMPDNMAALDALGDLVRLDATVYDFVGTYRELEKIYRKRDGAQALLARVLITQARSRERDGDLEAAEELYAAAIAEAPGDFAILDAQVDLWVRMRRFDQAQGAIERFLTADPELSVEICVRALTRRAEIAGDGQMDPERAIAACHEILKIAPEHQDAYYRLAQEHYLLGQLDEARRCIDQAIALAAAPGALLSPETLARYYYYLGRILEAAGEARSAASQYRRAADYDPGYSPPALALARRATDASDHVSAETLLINAAHEAMERGGPALAVPLQRGLARVLLAAGDRGAAIEAYRGILAVESEGAADRVALAEVYALSDVTKAIHELKKIFDNNLRHGPAYRLLASYYVRAGDIQRAARVLSVMEMLGYAEASDRAGEVKARALKVRSPITQPLTDDLRSSRLIAPDGGGPVAALWNVVGPWIGGLFPQPVVGENLVPLGELGDPTLPAAVAELARLFMVEPEVYGGDGVPGGVVAMAYPRPIVVIDRELCDDTDAVRRFALGWALDSIRGGYPLVLRLSERRKSELEGLLTSLLLPVEDRPAPTREFVASLPPQNAQVIEGLAGTVAEPREWISAMAATAKRAGLLAADDLVAATRMAGRLAGDALPVGPENTAALGLVLCGEDLIRHYLSDDYHQLREALGNQVG